MLRYGCRENFMALMRRVLLANLAKDFLRGILDRLDSAEYGVQSTSSAKGVIAEFLQLLAFCHDSEDVSVY